MNKLAIYLSVILLSLYTLPALALDDAVSTGFFNDTAIDGYDTVAYFTQGKPVAGDKKFKFLWREANWLFSSQENLDSFKQNPEKYAAQYGGYCAWAMAGNKNSPGNSPFWTIYQDKLYLNYDQKVQDTKTDGVLFHKTFYRISYQPQVKQ